MMVRNHVKKPRTPTALLHSAPAACLIVLAGCTVPVEELPELGTGDLALNMAVDNRTFYKWTTVSMWAEYRHVGAHDSRVTRAFWQYEGSVEIETIDSSGEVALGHPKEQYARSPQAEWERWPAGEARRLLLSFGEYRFTAQDTGEPYEPSEGRYNVRLLNAGFDLSSEMDTFRIQ